MATEKVTLLKQFNNLFSETGRVINNFVNKGNFHGECDGRTMLGSIKPNNFYQKKLKDGSVMLKGYNSENISSAETFIIHPDKSFDVIERPCPGIRVKSKYDCDGYKQGNLAINNGSIIRKNPNVINPLW